jgi:hypothetical protein
MYPVAIITRHPHRGGTKKPHTASGHRRAEGILMYAVMQKHVHTIRHPGWRPTRSFRERLVRCREILGRPAEIKQSSQ